MPLSYLYLKLVVNHHGVLGLEYKHDLLPTSVVVSQSSKTQQIVLLKVVNFAASVQQARRNNGATHTHMLEK